MSYPPAATPPPGRSYPPPPDGDFSPTAKLPRVGRRRYVNPDRPNMVIWVLVGAAVVMTIAAVIAVLKVGNDDTPPAAAPPAASTTAAPSVEPEAALTEAATVQPTPSSASATPRPSATTTQTRLRPSEIVSALRSAVRSLVAADELNHDDGDHLSSKLRSISGSLENGYDKRARRQAEELAHEVRELHDDEDLSDRGYQSLSAGISLLQRELEDR